MRTYEYTHVVLLEETNLVGNVYFTNHLRWQGKCREMFLRDQAPTVLKDLADGLALVTTRCSCEYLEELYAFDEVTIRMILQEMTQSRITLNFEYRRKGLMIARGSQQVACMRGNGVSMQPAPIPEALVRALEPD